MDKTCQFDRLWAKVGPKTHSARQFARKMPNNIPWNHFCSTSRALRGCIWVRQIRPLIEPTKPDRNTCQPRRWNFKIWLLVSQVSMNEACFLLFLAKFVMFFQLLDQNPSKSFEANFFEVYEIGDLLGSGSFGQVRIPGSPDPDAMGSHGLPQWGDRMWQFLWVFTKFPNSHGRFDW